MELRIRYFLWKGHTRTNEGGFRITIQKKADNIDEINIVKDLSDHDLADSKLIKELRSRICQALYVARESRPDMACSVYMLAQTLPNPYIQDLKDANKFIWQWKQKADHFLEIASFPDEEMIFLASTDSAWANCRSGHSQAGYFIGVISRSIVFGSECKVSPLV